MSCHPPRVTWTGKTKNKKNNNNEEEKKKTEQEKRKKRRKKTVLMQSLIVSVQLKALKQSIYTLQTYTTHS